MEAPGFVKHHPPDTTTKFPAARYLRAPRLRRGSQARLAQAVVITAPQILRSLGLQLYRAAPAPFCSQTQKNLPAGFAGFLACGWTAFGCRSPWIHRGVLFDVDPTLPPSYHRLQSSPGALCFVQVMWGEHCIQAPTSSLYFITRRIITSKLFKFSSYRLVGLKVFCNQQI